LPKALVHLLGFITAKKAQVSKPLTDTADFTQGIKVAKP
jgi:hypothetical protein